MMIRITNVGNCYDPTVDIYFLSRYWQHIRPHDYKTTTSHCYLFSMTMNFLIELNPMQYHFLFKIVPTVIVTQIVKE